MLTLQKVLCSLRHALHLVALEGWSALVTCKLFCAQNQPFIEVSIRQFCEIKFIFPSVLAVSRSSDVCKSVIGVPGNHTLTLQRDFVVVLTQFLSMAQAGSVCLTKFPQQKVCLYHTAYLPTRNLSTTLFSHRSNKNRRAWMQNSKKKLSGATN